MKLCTGPGTPDRRRIPFYVDHPRLTGFLGRDEALTQLDTSLKTAGPTGIRPAGISGMGGIGKTQLAVEYAHRYRYFYRHGVFMINAAATSWTRQFADIALRMRLPPDDHRQPEAMADALLRYLDEHRDALVILDNVKDTTSLRRRTIGHGSTAATLPCRLLFTTRQRFEADGLQALPIDVLSPGDARKLLTSTRSDIDLEDPAVEHLSEALGRLPLALALGAAFLQRKPKATPAAYLAHLERRGLDATHRQAGLRKGELEAYEETSVGPALRAQWRLLESKDTCPSSRGGRAARGERPHPRGSRWSPLRSTR